MPEAVNLFAAAAVIEAAQEKAEKLGVPMNIAVVDAGANLVAFCSMDGTKLIGVDISQKKALTAVYFQLDTKDLAPLVQPGAPIYGIESTTDGKLVVFGGGVLLRTSAGEIAGAVGVSAGSVDEDHQVAEAGRKAFGT